MFRLLAIATVFILAFQNCEDPKPPAKSSYGSSSNDTSSPEIYSIEEFDFPPVIVTHPDNNVRLVGQQISLSAMVQPDYQKSARYSWYHNGNLILGQTQKYLELKQIQPENAGTYHAVIRVGEHVLTSEKAHLVILDSSNNVHPPVQSGAVIIDQNGNLINYNWQTQNFSSCSVPCGPGQTTRVVRCVMLPSNIQVDDNFCQSKKPEQITTCNGNRCSMQYNFTNYGNKARGTADVTASISESNSEMAERVFASLCDQGQFGCGSFDRCEYPRVPGQGDDGSASSCRLNDDQQSYNCTATCRNF